ncbi:hypothetical protein HYH03_008314 [Edaphochlamys debaryana]|uniref:Fatty acid desaturase domain-containing protein n=1 Tax=Edaphochlamys debaryana TaxID=47281 RepID=A0A836BZK3_9CHLO|nr:hypothetical protein HYH03_008314 [Edaphochlamys debaryana]|eukprot:KAG2493498.1 hypothetical protein HYH03_008314 [Edaphochlamys debaryana]
MGNHERQAGGEQAASSTAALDPVSLAQRDLRSRREEYIWAMPGPFAKRLRAMLADPRDEPAAYLLCNQLLLVVPAVVLLFLFNRNHWVGVLYLVANYALFLQRFMLTLHVTQHRRLFRQEFSYLNALIPYVLSNLYGVPMGFYRPHHVVMHHVEDNWSPGDLTATDAVPRNSLPHFARYWMRFLLGTWFELPAYLARKGRSGEAVATALSGAAYWAGIAALWRVNPVATLWSLLVPLLVSTFALMFGNWSQHVFVDPDEPRNVYRSTYNCMDCFDNRRTYNDGYHVIHHLNSRLHWSEMPQKFIDTLQAHDDNDALAFRGIGFFDVGVMVFTGQLDKLASHIVPCGPKQAARSREEWVALLRHRLQPCRRRAQVPKSAMAAAS